MFLSLLAGCTKILGLDDVVLVDDAGVNDTPSGDGGAGPFVLTGVPERVEVPYGSWTGVLVQIERDNDFIAAVDVTIDQPASGLMSRPLTIAAGQTQGVLELSASLTLVIGTSFPLVLSAASGNVRQTTEIEAVVVGTPGSLDESFGDQGKVDEIAVPAHGPGARLGTLVDLIILDDGRMVSAGEVTGGEGEPMAVAMFLADGTLDTSFGAGGVALVRFCSCVEFVSTAGIAALADGALLVAGSRYEDDVRDLTLVRLDASGAFDPAFGSGGKVVADLGGDEVVKGMAVDDAGRITVVGQDSSSGAMFVARFLADGSLDPDFATGGQALFTIADGGTTGSTVTIDAAGRIIVAGDTDVPGDLLSNIVVVRLLPDGSPDGEFGESGVLLLSTTERRQNALDVALDQKGQLILTGSAALPVYRSPIGWLVLRLTMDGALDQTFGLFGSVEIDFSQNSEARDTILLPDGQYIVAGASGGMGTVAKLRADGTLDPYFGKDAGTITLGDFDSIRAVRLHPDGWLVAAGRSYDSALLARLWY